MGILPRVEKDFAVGSEFAGRLVTSVANDHLEVLGEDTGMEDSNGTLDGKARGRCRQDKILEIRGISTAQRAEIEIKGDLLDMKRRRIHLKCPGTGDCI